MHRVTSESPLAKKIVKKLPTIIEKRTDLQSATIERVNKKPKFSMEEEKLKMKKTKEAIIENKIERKEEAKLVFESNRLLKENFLILKDIIM